MVTPRRLAALLAILAASIVPAHAEALAATATERMDVPTAVNMAGRQRMLSQRMVKAYLMLGQGIATDDAQRILQQSISQFDSHLAALKAFQPTPIVRNALGNLEGTWNQFKALLAAAPSKAGALDLYEANEALLQATHSTTLAYEKASLAPRDRLIGIAGRQRMLSQRMAKFYFYRAWNLREEAVDMELHLSRAHFTAVLNQIGNSPLASAPVKAHVAHIRREWAPYQQALFANRAPSENQENALRVAASSERVLAAAEELVAQLVAEAQADAAEPGRTRIKPSPTPVP